MRLILLPLLLSISATPVLSQDVPATPPVVVANTVEVKGVLPGPGFWQASKGGNTVWILASIRPVPKGMEWETIDADQIKDIMEGRPPRTPKLPPATQFGNSAGTAGPAAGNAPAPA